jgi:hypothetical protein
MDNFKDAYALHTVLKTANPHLYGVEPGRKGLIDGLISSFKFTQQQAAVYASTVLSKSTENSADMVLSNARNVEGNWVRGDMSGSAAAYLRTLQETWIFRLDLTYEHKTERYEGYNNPFGGYYSKPSSNVEHGIWAVSDDESDDIKVVIIRVIVVGITVSSPASVLNLSLSNKGTNRYGTTVFRHCKINNEHFGRL